MKPLEWVCFLISLVITLGAVGLCIYGIIYAFVRDIVRKELNRKDGKPTE